MRRRTFFLFFILFFTSGLLYLGFERLYGNQKWEDARYVIPENVSTVFFLEEVDQWKKINATSQIWRTSKEANQIPISSAINVIDSLVHHQCPFIDMSGSLWATLCENPQQEFPLLIFENKEANAEALPRWNYKILNDSIDQINGPGLKEALYTFNANNFRIMSASHSLVLKAYTAIQQQQTLLEASASFNRLFNTRNTYSDIHLYIRSNKKREWQSYDLSYNTDLLALDGLGIITDSTSVLHTFSDQTPVKINCWDIIPNNTTAFLHFGNSDIQQLKARFLEAKSLSNRALSRQQEMVERIGLDLNASFVDWVGDEIMSFYIHKKQYVAFSIHEDYSHAFTILREAQNKIANYFSETHDPIVLLDEYEVIKIDHLPIYQSLMFPKPFQLQNVYYTQIGNYIVGAETLNELHYYLKRLQFGKTVKQKPDSWMDIGLLASQSNALVLLHPNEKPPKDLLSMVQHNAFKFPENHVDWLGWQMSQADDSTQYHHIFLTQGKSNDAASTTSSSWKTVLNGAVNKSPVPILNHRTKLNNFAIQDSLNILYLLNEKGEITWAHPIKERINGEIHSVDLFKNNKTQLLFSTNNFIHCYDINGLKVDGFPVKLPESASAPVGVIDYDHNKNYRLVIPCYDQKVYNYDGKGNNLKGWTVHTTDTIVKQKFQHVNINQKDYIYSYDQNGHIYLFNRRGEIRHEVIAQLIKSPSDQAYFFKGNTIDLSGYVYAHNNNLVRLKFNNTIDTIPFKNGKIDQFYAENINADEAKEYIIVDSNKVTVLGYDFSTIYDETFLFAIDQLAFNKHQLLVAAPNNEIYLLEEGSISDHSPYSGNSFSTIVTNGSSTNVLLSIQNRNEIHSTKLK